MQINTQIYIGETERRLGDRFSKHVRDVEVKDTRVPHYNLLNHSKRNMATCGLSLHLADTESRKNKEQRCIFQRGSLSPNDINERF